MAAGRGTRLRPWTDTIPKPLLPIAGRGTLLRTFDALPSVIDEVIVVVGYLQEQIRVELGETYAGKRVTYVVQDPLDGTGGALRRVESLVRDEPFFILNGDDLYSRKDLESMCKHSRSILVCRKQITSKNDTWKVKDGHVCELSTSPAGSEVLVNAGAYVLGHEWFETTPVLVPGKTDEWSLPHAIPQILSRVPHIAIEATYWQPCGTPEEVQVAERLITSWQFFCLEGPWCQNFTHKMSRAMRAPVCMITCGCCLRISIKILSARAIEKKMSAARYSPRTIEKIGMDPESQRLAAK